MERIGVLGGTFDPPHIGHLAAAEDAASTLHLDKVLFVPNRVPPHKADQLVSPVADRLAMVELCTGDNPCFVLSKVELERPGPSYTLDTMRQLRRQLGSAEELFFLTGCDSIVALHTWHQPETLLQEFRVVVLDRPIASPINWAELELRFPHIREQVEVLDVPLLEISSQQLRHRVAEGRPIRYYVLPTVDDYIRDHKLYRHAHP
ncbi:MAG: nicotinate-nucleotide adenylyltransferase [Chloroflexota bacterium]|nr:nicotinate-nucleotide adenylyltransferase [Chloroflexota bacterium]